MILPIDDAPNSLCSLCRCRVLPVEYSIGIPKEGTVPCFSDHAACIKTGMIGADVTGGTCRSTADIPSGFYQYYVYLSTTCRFVYVPATGMMLC